MKKIHALIIFLLSLYGCTKDVDKINLPSAQSKPVVECFLSPDSPLTILKLYPTYPINSTSEYGPSIADAQVRIYNSEYSALLKYDSVKYAYTCDTSSLKIVKGQKYFLKITLSNGEEITAECEIPSLPVPHYTSNIQAYGDTGFDYDVSIINSEHEDAFGILQFSIPYLSNDLSDTLYFGFDFITTKLLKTQETTNINGNYTISDYSLLLVVQSIPNYPYAARLLICDEQTYLFHKRLPRFVSNDATKFQSFNYQFNIIGGLGIFGSYYSK